MRPPALRHRLPTRASALARLGAGVAFALLTLAAAPRARAQLTGTAGTIGTTTPTTLAAGDFFIGVQSTEGTNLNVYDLPRFFNKANCDCDVPVFVYVTLTASGLAKRSSLTQTTTGKLQVFVGTNCGYTPTQPELCAKIFDGSLATFMANGRQTVQTSAKVMSTDTTTLETVDGGVTNTTGVFTTTTDCSANEISFSQTIFVEIDTDGNGVYDVSPEPTQVVTVDLTPPTAPAVQTVAPGDQAITVGWSPVDYSTNMDLQGYQVLCRRGYNLQVFPTSAFGEYVKTCHTQYDGLQGPEALNPMYACSPLLNISDSSYRVKILQNGIVYGATVVAIDNSGNASAPFMQYAVPAKTDSFYDVYRNGENGNAGPISPSGGASGGFCAVAGRDVTRPHAGAGLALAAGGAVALAIARRRRRRP
jgi:hypothetical protein